MIKNYLLIAFRNMKRNKAFTVINITGLAVGFAACLLLFMVVRYEFSYDLFQKNYSCIHRLVTEDDYSEGVSYTSGVPFPALEAIRVAFPQVVTGSILANNGSQVTVPDTRTGPEKKFIEENGFFFCDPEFFQVFKQKWLAGSPEVLRHPGTTVLTRKMAEKYFGQWQAAVGSMLRLDNTVTVKVAGVIENPPANTDFPLAVITSRETAKANPDTYGYTNDWGNTTSNFQLYMLLPEAVSPAAINTQLRAFSKKVYTAEKNRKRFNFIVPLSSVHFDSRFGNMGDHVTGKSTLWTLSLIGLFIIIMACINFINLSTAQAVGRSKEVGIRKVLGSNRLQLFGQVMGETVIIVVIAVAFSLLLAAFCLPFIKHIASIPEQLSLLTGQTALFLLATALLVTLLAGMYPALTVSGFTPALALKNKISSASIGGISLRRGLVVLQFAISQVLIIGTIVAISQMNFIRQADLGFNKEALFVMNVNADSAVHARQDAFKAKLLQIPGVQSVSFSSDIPSSENNWSGNFAVDHKPDEKFDIYRKAGDEDYFSTYGLQVIAGHAFEKSDTATGVVVNETLVKKLGYQTPNDILGKEIRSGRPVWKPIVGVVKDFKTNSLREDVKPLMILARKERYSVTGVKIKSSNPAKTQAAIEKAWNEDFPEYAYTSSYMDDTISRFYQQEDQLSLLYKIFAGIAILISCLGLYGLVSFMAVQRTKEIGVRKVLGASVQHIVVLFSRELTLLVITGFLIAAPVAWYMMSGWLQHFVFRIPLGVSIFLPAIVCSVAIAWFTVGYESLKAALADPVKSLRSE